MPDRVNVMALTATANNSTMRFVMQSLSMQAPHIAYISPSKDNIFYDVVNKPKDNSFHYFSDIISDLRTNNTLDRIIIFCRTRVEVAHLYKYFKEGLGPCFTVPRGAPDLAKYRVIDMYTHSTHDSVKQAILEQFTSASQLRIVIATIAFGMGINCPDVRHIIHWTAPGDIETYVQETGRAGRDGLPSKATIVVATIDLDSRFMNEEAIQYCKNTTACCRTLIFSNFKGCSRVLRSGCKCCFVCRKKCTCGECTS